MTGPSWQSRVVQTLVRVRMRPHAFKPIDPAWVRINMGRPRVARRFMARSTGATLEQLIANGRWPGGERLSWPSASTSQLQEGETRHGGEMLHGSDTQPVMLYLHGGGFIACSPETHRPLVGSIVRRTGFTAYVPAYRLAPEHPYPAALEDAVGAYDHLVQDLGVDPARIVVAGDSAGGGLALALVMSIRDRGTRTPSALVLFSPWTDLAATGASLDENSDRCAMFAGDTIRRASRFYVGEQDPRHPLLSPLYGVYEGLPPILLHASHDEVLRDDTLRVAERARVAGVDVTLRMWHGVPHVWQFFAAVLPEARESLSDAVAFMHRVTNTFERHRPSV